jgi:hypothetical protein
MCTIHPFQTGLFVPQKSPYGTPPYHKRHISLRVLPPLEAEEATCPSPQSLTTAPHLFSSLRNMERRVPSLQMFMGTMYADLQTDQTPDQPVQHSESPRRSSSVYTRATGVWDDEHITPTRPCSESQSLSASNPQLSASPNSPSTPWSSELINPIPPLLEPRDCAPLLPLPSPSLGPHSRKSSYVPPLETGFSSERSGQNDGWWNSLALSPPSSPIQRGRKMSRSTVDLSSLRHDPTPAIMRARSTSPLASRLSSPFSSHIGDYSEESRNKALASLGVTAEEASLPHGGLEKKKTPSRFFNYTREYTLHTSTSRSLTVLPGLSRTNRSVRRIHAASTEKADVSNVIEEQQDEESKTEPEPVSAEIHRPFVYEYQDLAAPSQSQWDDSSEDEDKGGYLRLVPAPLFWKNRQQELYPKRVEHFLANKEIDDRSQDFESKGAKWGKRKKEDGSTTSTPLSMSLDDQSKEQDRGRGRATSTSPKPQTRSFFKSRNRAQSKPDSLRSHARQNKKDANEPPLPLELSSIAYNHSSPFGSPNSGSVKSAQRSPRVASHSRVSLDNSPMKPPPSQAYAWPHPAVDSTSQLYGSGRSDVAASSGFSDMPLIVDPSSFKEIEHLLNETVIGSRPSSRSTHKPTQSASTTYSRRSSASSQAEGVEQTQEYSRSLPAMPRSFDQYTIQIASSPPIMSPISEIPTLQPRPAAEPARATYSVFHKGWTTRQPEQSAFERDPSHKRTVSSTSEKGKRPIVTLDTIGVPYTDMRIRDKQVDVQSKLERNSSSSRPTFIEKALGVKRERERRKHRKELIASIKHVGRTNPEDDDDDRGRRGTFGEGWS